MQGLLAPVGASIALFASYLFIKFFPDFSLQTFFDLYFWLLGSFALSGGAVTILKAVPGFDVKRIHLDLPSWLLKDGEGVAITSVDASPADVLGVVVGVAVATLEVAGHHNNFTLSNLIACMVATDILQLLGVKSFKTATVLLFGMLLSSASLLPKCRLAHPENY